MNQIEVPDITVEMWEAGRAAYADWIFRTYRQGMPTEEDRDESARIAIAAMRAAAPAASGGECHKPCTPIDFFNGDACPDCVTRDYSPQTPVGASVSERGE